MHHIRPYAPLQISNNKLSLGKCEKLQPEDAWPALP
ncbi:unnamed protein product [Haemonchus placei]|uniref:Uncharacterized protein n=1 Tax=Haemonchus placei TaxID=6290 RepID=A0A0N4WKG1_HAEPC|nr:unnamed protein product [Haemonchus placei]